MAVHHNYLLFNSQLHQKILIAAYLQTIVIIVGGILFLVDVCVQGVVVASLTSLDQLQKVNHDPLRLIQS